jgi:hypothetical protein
MSTTPDADEAVTPGTTFACVAATLVLIVLSTEFGILLRHDAILHQRLDLRYLPAITNTTLECGPYLWVPSLAATAWGFRLLLTRGRSSALSWFLWAILLLILALGWMSFTLAYGFPIFGNALLK